MAAAAVSSAKAPAFAVGQPMPNPNVVVLKPNSEGQLKRFIVPLHSLFNQAKNVIIHTFPAAFSPTCGGKHLPSVLEERAKYKAHNIKVICITTDAIHATEKWNATDDQVAMASDINREFGKATNLLDVADPDPTLGGAAYPILGRSSITIEGGIVTNINKEPRASCEVTKGDVALGQLSAKVAAVSATAVAATSTDFKG